MEWIIELLLLNRYYLQKIFIFICSLLHFIFLPPFLPLLYTSSLPSTFSSSSISFASPSLYIFLSYSFSPWYFLTTTSQFLFLFHLLLYMLSSLLSFFIFHFSLSSFFFFLFSIITFFIIVIHCILPQFSISFSVFILTCYLA